VTQGRGTARRVDEVVESLRRASSEKARREMARYGISDHDALGVPMRVMKEIAKDIGTDHALALDLWTTGIYEARTVAAFIDDPAVVTSAQMDRWASSFNSWAICDTTCFHLFDRTAHAWTKVPKWNSSKKELVKRASYTLLWALALHDKTSATAKFTTALRMVEKAAPDDRPLVTKAADMALRAVGKRNATLRAAAVTVARRLADSDEPSRKWVGRKALKGL
jgi:3-methyladenine DNA glycosylase AlkD